MRVAHGDVYTNERKFRFGLIDDPKCARCQHVETLKHKFYECLYVKKIWDELGRKLNKLSINYAIIDPEPLILAAYKDGNPAIMTLTAETLLRISYLKDNDNFLRCPKALIKSIINHVLKLEGNESIKNMIKTLLD